MKQAINCTLAAADYPGLATDEYTIPLTLKIPDIQGTYTIPYIQSSPYLKVNITFADIRISEVKISVCQGDKELAAGKANRQLPAITFPVFGCGEYELVLIGYGTDGTKFYKKHYTNIGIGMIICAIGDSITEGYHSRGFKLNNLTLNADRFPREVVSRNRRNFPQFSPTTHIHRPDVNCFVSWMTELNDCLSKHLDSPVFIANEGWGGITTERYLQMIRSNKGWRDRMKQLRPEVWLIHLGVNDERAKVPATKVATNLNAIIDVLINDFDAIPKNIFLANPSYDYALEAEEILAGYVIEINKIIQRRGLAAGPDFFKAYAKEKIKLYGEDPVHPNEEGMKLMSKLWFESIKREFDHYNMKVSQ